MNSMQMSFTRCGARSIGEQGLFCGYDSSAFQGFFDVRIRSTELPPIFFVFSGESAP